MLYCKELAVNLKKLKKLTTSVPLDILWNIHEIEIRLREEREKRGGEKYLKN